ncbi:four-carbon acid sugar kinase family protein [Undibacterium sp.]|uniref:four-carbon acid sugar kinase family protein n=1 Tax=Undibacterium sp. TaxID=1914977 RepID=UPI00374DED69
MAQVLIIADDLSGAADCASAFVKNGLETLVLIEQADSQVQHVTAGAGATMAQVISIDADTRRLPGADAARAHVALYGRYRAAGQLLYKKIDSTLRGNFAEELAAIIDEAGMAIVAPAFPQAGRLTMNGHQYLNDTPLEKTDIWRGEGISGTAHIPAMLARHGIRTASITLNEIRQGAQQLRSLLESYGSNGVQAVVCDAAADGDLQAIAQASVGLSVPRFWVGSAGLANHLPAAARELLASAAQETTGSRTAVPATAIADGSILTVVGSVSGISRSQAEYLFSKGHTERLDVPAAVLRQGLSHPRWQELDSTLAALLENRRDVLVMIGMEGPLDMAEGLQLCQALAQMIAPLAGHISAVIATGGETARAILSAMGTSGLRLTGEIEPGVPLSVADGARPITVITKAGAFGSLDTLFRSHETLRAMRAP